MFIDALLIFILILTLLLLCTAVVNMISGSPFVPSNRRTLDLMLEKAHLKKGTLVYDLGCGDGRLLIRAEKKYSIQGIGYENAPIAFLIGLLNKIIHRSHVSLRFKNFFKSSLKDADFIFLYLGPEVQVKLAPKLKKECRHGTLIISNTFHLPGFKPFKTFPKDKIKKTNTVYLYKMTK